MKVVLINKNGQKDISQLVSSMSWSGGINQAARKLDFNIATSPHDFYLPKVYVELGNMIKLLNDDDSELFTGYVFYKDIGHQSTEMKVTAYDGLRYFRSEVSYNFTNITAEDITKRICNDLGVQIGTLEPTNIPLSKIYMKKKAFDVLKDAYKNASDQNDIEYVIKMIDSKLNTIKKGSKAINYILDNASNLSDSNYSESIENMVNKVLITDEKGNKIGEVSNSDWLSNYGVLQKVYKQEKNKDSNTIATNMLKGIDRKGSVSALGNVEAITGNAIKIKEKYTGTTGLFYIDNDVHTFQDGQHTMKLVLNFQNMIDD